MQSSIINLENNLKMHRSNGTKVLIGASGSIVNGVNSGNIINNSGITVGGGGVCINTTINNKTILTGNVTGGGGGGVGNNIGVINGGALNGPLDTLPKQFVTSMKTLFDILDDQKTGLVKLSDIEKGWQDDGCKGLPHGVIDSLHKVTPSNGLLSFERFCAGLKICLLRNQNEQQQQQHQQQQNRSHRSRQSIVINQKQNLTAESSSSSSSKIKPSRPPSAPLLDIENPIPNAQWTTNVATGQTASTNGATVVVQQSNNTATVRPNNTQTTQQTQRTLSLPQLSPDSDLDIICDTIMPDIYGPPPKPPRSSILTAATTATSSSNSGIDKAEIRHVLQNWQMGILMNEMDAKDKRKNNNNNNNNFTINRLARGTADGGAAETGPSQSPNNLYQKKPNIKRREPRRHTLQNGIDYNMLKRLKQFEEERDVLLQGLAAVEKAREWYLKQISNVQEKIKYLGRMGSHMEQWSEAHQERLDLQRARVLELNRHLSVLADSWERGGFPLHMNLAVRHGIYQSAITQLNNNATTTTTTTSSSNNNDKNNVLTRLKQQNRQLTDEVSQKSDRITLLEREKQSLIHELVQLQHSCDLIGINSSTNTIEGSDAVF